MCMPKLTPHLAYRRHILGEGVPHFTSKREQTLKATLRAEALAGDYDNPAIYHPAFSALIKLAAANMPNAQSFVVGMTIYEKKISAFEVIGSITSAFIHDGGSPGSWAPATQTKTFATDLVYALFIADWMARLTESHRPPEVVALLDTSRELGPNWLAISTARHQKAAALTPKPILTANQDRCAKPLTFPTMPESAPALAA